jgi:Kef-type K+ transport system membrane component KefB
LVPFFFVYVGLQVDLRGMGPDALKLALAVAALTLVAVAGKLVSALGVLEKGLDRLAVGVGMVPRGEVGLIFALVGLTTLVGGKPLMEPWEYTAILLVVALTTFVTPLWLKAVLGRRRRSVAEDGPEA